LFFALIPQCADNPQKWRFAPIYQSAKYQHLMMLNWIIHVQTIIVDLRGFIAVHRSGRSFQGATFCSLVQCDVKLA